MTTSDGGFPPSPIGPWSASLAASLGIHLVLALAAAGVSIHLEPPAPAPAPFPVYLVALTDAASPAGAASQPAPAARRVPPAPVPAAAPPPAAAPAPAPPTPPADDAASGQPDPARESEPAESRTPARPAGDRVSIGGAPAPAPLTAAPPRPPEALPAPAPPARPARPAVAALPPPPPALPIGRPARPREGYLVQPEYPPAARRAGAEGTAVLRVHVLPDGTVGEVDVKQSAGQPDLDRAAAEAVHRWRFDPARSGDEAVAMWVLIPVQFRLR